MTPECAILGINQQSRLRAVRCDKRISLIDLMAHHWTAVKEALMIPIEKLPDNPDQLSKISSLQRSLDDEEITSKVKAIVKAVRKEGDQALARFSSEFDGTDLDPACIKVTEQEIDEAHQKVDRDFLDALRTAKKRIYSYHLNQKEMSWFVTEDDGVLLGQVIRPIERIGIYVPGGLASYPSSVLMNAIPAKVAGVNEIVMCTPPCGTGDISPHSLVAAKEAGVDEIYKVGGAQAIAALAFGTGTIKKVHKIAGPGNIFVTLAKKLVVGEVDIDMLAGPSEIVIVADMHADARYIAADMLGQAEHAPDASAILITTSPDLADQVNEALGVELDQLGRQTIAAASLKDSGRIFIVDSIDQALTAANLIAPEHLELMLDDPFSYLSKVRNAGAIFLGSNTPEAIGDYVAGTNHVLPTGGTSRFYSPLGVYDFVKRMSVLSYSKAGLQKVGRHAEILAQAEGLDAHAKSVRARLETK
jgi:histidinol dehydrogenase